VIAAILPGSRIGDVASRQADEAKGVAKVTVQQQAAVGTI